MIGYACTSEAVGIAQGPASKGYACNVNGPSAGRAVMNTAIGRACTTGHRGTTAGAFSKGLSAGGSAVGRQGGGRDVDSPVIGWEPLSHYDPVITHDAAQSGDLHPYWQRDMLSNGAEVTFRISLDRPAKGGETVTWTAVGDAVVTTHWTTTAASTVTLELGQTFIDVPITPVESTAWYREKTVKLNLSGTGVRLNTDRDYIHLVFNSAVLPPTLTLTGPSTKPPDDSFDLTVTADYEVQEAVRLWVLIDPTSPAGFTKDENGIVVIAAGQTVGTISMSQTGGATGTLKVSLIYEDKTVRFTELDFNHSTYKLDVPRNVYENENMWRRSNDINLLAYEFNPEATDLPVTPGHPTAWAIDGTTPADHNISQVTPLAQTQSPKRLDPVTGNELMMFSPNHNVVNGIPYIRQSFETVYCGGALTAHSALNFVRTRYYIAFNSDNGKNCEFHRVSVRVRNRNRNHGIVFRTSVHVTSGEGYLEHSDLETVGTDFFTWSNGIKVWAWHKYNGHEDSDDKWGTYYGAGEDSNGFYIWFQHQIDEGLDYGDHNGEDGGSAVDEPWWTVTPANQTPAGSGVHHEYPVGKLSPEGHTRGDSILPLNYPIWFSATDGSKAVANNNLNYIRNNGSGVMMHSMEFNMKTTAMNAPGQFWPCEKSRWDPRGLAVIAADGTETHSVTITSGR